MNYRIDLYETFDGNGISTIELFMEIDGQIYRSYGRYVEKKDKKMAIRKCFKEMSRYFNEEKK